MSQPRILYLVHRFPFPPDKGDRIRAFHIIKHLAPRCELHLATLADEPVSDAAAAELSRYCDSLHVVPLPRFGRRLGGLRSAIRGGTISGGMFASACMDRLIDRLAETVNPNRVLLSASSLVPYLERPALRSIPAVVDLVDVDSQKWCDYALHSLPPGRWLYQFEAGRMARLETRLPANVEAVTLVSEAEADLYGQVCHRQATTDRASDSSRGGHAAAPSVYAIPNGVDLEYFSPIERPAELSCVFVGAMDYRPNVDAVNWFCREVWPEVREQLPQARFQIVGRRPVRSVRRLARISGVEVVGGVPDVRPWLAAASAVVAPLCIARGLQNKVLEAMAMAKPVVATPQSLAGLDVEPDEHVLQARSADEFARLLCECLTEASLRARLGAAARRFAESRHRWSHSLDGLARPLGLPTVNVPSTTHNIVSQLAAVH